MEDFVKDMYAEGTFTLKAIRSRGPNDSIAIRGNLAKTSGGGRLPSFGK